MKIGIELEFLIPRNNIPKTHESVPFNYVIEKLRSNGVEANWESYNHTTRRSSWKLVTDGSVNYENCYGYELVSPPFIFNEEGIKNIVNVCKALNSVGCVIKNCCGLHVHVDARDMDLDLVKIIFNRYKKFENKIDEFMPKSRRSSNDYCRPLSRVDLIPDAQTIGDLMRDRYYKINVRSYVTYGTIEFRHHSGTIDSTKIINWIKFLKGFIESSKEFKTQMEKSVAEETEKLINAKKTSVTKDTEITRSDMIKYLAYDMLETSLRNVSSRRSLTSLQKITECFVNTKNNDEVWARQINENMEVMRYFSPSIIPISHRKWARYSRTVLKLASGLSSNDAFNSKIDMLYDTFVLCSKMMPRIMGVNYYSDRAITRRGSVATSWLPIGAPMGSRQIDVTALMYIDYINDALNFLITSSKPLWELRSEALQNLRYKSIASAGSINSTLEKDAIERKVSAEIFRNDDLFKNIDNDVKQFYMERANDLAA